MSSDRTSQIEGVLAGPLAGLGLDLDAVELTPAGKRRVLRVVVDAEDGVSLDDIAEATKEINALLDDDETMGEQPYTLEVTSRGVDRPLTLPRHWQRNVDRLVKVTLVDGDPVTGRIRGVEEESVTLEVDGDERTIAVAEIRKALVQVEFNARSGGQ
ncbi:ribosome maturation factor RimP [Nocardioides limicola]|uniref:ribosome maturation factor RimP n=1 Tax=Nocardioides limicola TaxID=2803368 RepID=UPI00193AE0FC|nr:ribosome maturation factor RimP [Nocardioides sp. DJM-14]